MSNIHTRTATGIKSQLLPWGQVLLLPPGKMWRSLLSLRTRSGIAIGIRTLVQVEANSTVTSTKEAIAPFMQQL